MGREALCKTMSKSLPKCIHSPLFKFDGWIRLVFITIIVKGKRKGNGKSKFV